MVGYYNENGLALDMKNMLNVQLPQPVENGGSTSFSFSTLGKLYKKSANGNKVYKCNYSSITAFKEVCTSQFMEVKADKMTAYIDTIFRKEFNLLSIGTKYAVKVIKVETYSTMVSGLNEVCMHNEIFRVSDTLVSKPFFSAPFRNGKLWCYVIVSEFIEGKTLNDMRLTHMFTSEKQKKEIKSTICKTIHQLWWNGYSHNNLTRDNIIYDSRTNSVKLVGLSNCVIHPFDEVYRFRANIADYNREVTIARELQNRYKKGSVLLAGLSGIPSNIEKVAIYDMAINAYYF